MTRARQPAGPSSEPPSAGPEPGRPRLVTPALARLFVATGGGLTGIALLMSVAPHYASEAGGAGGTGAGLVTGTLLGTTIASEVVVPRLVARYGHRRLFAVALLSLGLPTVALFFSAHLATVVAVSALRGVGFGVVVVLGAVLVAEVVPAERRGEGLGMHGVVIGVPLVLALPFGVVLIGQVGYAPVFAVATLAPLLGLAAVPGMPGRAARGAAGGGHGASPVGVVAALRAPALARPAAVLAAGTVAGGVVVTFLPLAVTGGDGVPAAAGLLLQALAATVARWWAGRFGDRHGPGRLLLPGLIAAAGGMLLLAAAPATAAVLAGAALFGTGFGVVQNASLVQMFARVPAAGYGAASAVWNLFYDAGMGLGAAGFGVFVAHTGYSAGFAVTAGLMLCALVPAIRDRYPPPSRRAGSATVNRG